MTGTQLRTVVVGLGNHAERTVLPAVAEARGWELTGIVSAHAEADGDRQAPTFRDVSSCVAAIVPDAAYVAAVPAAHASTCIELIEAGVPLVVCEKPLALDLDQVRTVLDKARTRSAAVVEVLAYQHHPQFARLTDLLESAEVGGLAHGWARFSYPHLPPENHRYAAAAGGGALLDAGIYPLSLAIRLLAGRPLEVQARAHRGEGEVDASGTATLTDDLGRAFQVSWAMGTAYANLARIVGRTGSVEVPRPFSKPADYAEPIVHIAGDGERSPVTYQAGNQFAIMLEDIAAHRDDPSWVDATHRDAEARWAVIERVGEAVATA